MRRGIKPLLTGSLLLGSAALCIALASCVSAQDIEAFLLSCGYMAPLVYICLFALLPAFFFPVAVLALAGGLLFGLGLGSLYTFIGALLNCALMFFLSRHAGRAKVQAFVQRKLSPAWQKRLQAAGGRSGFLLLVILRLIPAVPYNLINYAFGLTEMSFGAYMLASAIGIIPGTLVFINIGDKAMNAGSPAFWLAIGLLVLLLAVTSLLGKRFFPGTTAADTDKNTDGALGEYGE